MDQQQNKETDNSLKQTKKTIKFSQKYVDSIKTKLDIEHVFDIECWYDFLKDHTFETEFIPVNIEEGISIRKLYQYYNFRQSQQQKFPELYQNIIDNFKTKIAPTLKSFQQSFIRLSTRSPKDAVFDFSDPQRKEYVTKSITKELYKIGINQDILIDRAFQQFQEQQKQIDQFITGEQLASCLKDQELNLLLIWFFDFLKQFLIVEQKPEQSLNLLANSERVFTDLARLLTWRGNDSYEIEEIDEKMKTNELCNLSIRKWENISDQNEFRCFFNNLQLTAISQYNHYIYIKNLQDTDIQNNIKRIIYNKFEIVKDILEKHEIRSGVIDFYVKNMEEEKQEKDNNNCFIIELNPFNNYEGAGTGGSLFDWNQDKDILEGNYFTQLPNYPQVQYQDIAFRSKQTHLDGIAERIFPLFDGQNILEQACLDIYTGKNNLGEQQKDKKKKCIIF